MYEEKMQYDAWNRSKLIILTHKCYFTNLPLTFLFIYKLTMPYKFNNMQFMNLNMLSEFMQVLNINEKHYTKNEYFIKYILFTTFYLL
jgi:hypothetical protein